MTALTTAHLLFFAAGVAAAGLYLGVFWYAVVLFVRHRSPVPLIAGSLARLMLLGGLGLGAFSAQPSALELASAIAGFLLTRMIVLKRVPLADPGTGRPSERSA